MKGIGCYVGALAVMLSVSGCANNLYQQSRQKVLKTQSEMLAVAQSSNKTPTVVVKNDFYVDTTPVSLKKPAPWLKHNIVIQADKMPLSLLMHRLLHKANVGVSYDDTVNAAHPVSINYSGTMEGAFRRIAASTGYHYVLEKDSLIWSAFITKTFNISFMPGRSTYLVGQTRNEQLQQQKGQEGHQLSHLSDQQYSNLQGTLSVWRDLERTLGELKSIKGKVVVSESTSSVTVRDRPQNVRAMVRYIAKLNHSLSQEVGIRVQVLEIALDKKFNYGINWNMVKSALHTQFSLTGSLAKATNLSPASLISENINSAVVGFQIGKAKSHALIDALEQQGHLRVVTKPQVVTMNNQVASIRITKNTAYIRSVDSSRFQEYESTSITPGSIEDGFTLYLLPKVQGKKVYMQISSRVANLLSLQKASTNPVDTRSSTNENSKFQYNAIELPTIVEKEFNQRSVVTSGSTLIIAGYRRLRDRAESAKLYGLTALGGQGAESETVETLVLITPNILNSTS